MNYSIAHKNLRYKIATLKNHDASQVFLLPCVVYKADSCKFMKQPAANKDGIDVYSDSWWLKGLNIIWFNFGIRISVEQRAGAFP